MNNNLAYPIAGNQYHAVLDSKIFDVTRPFTRFYRVSKWAKTRVNEGQSWRDTGTAIGGGAAGGYPGLYNC